MQQADALHAQALAHHTAGRLDDAAGLYRQVLAIAPNHPSALANMAMLCQQRRALTDAETYYQKALALGRSPALLSNLALLHRERGDADAAAALLREALLLQPGFPNALYNLGVTLLDAGRPAEALPPLQQRARDPAAGADVHANLARALLELGRRPEAVAHGRAALLIKDRLACQAFAARGLRPLPAITMPLFVADRKQRNVIAFSLWGTQPRHVDGAIANARLARALYAGWTCRVYLDDSVPRAARDGLAQEGAQLVAMPRADGHAGLYWRFLAADDPNVDYFLCRDADSRLNTQEAAAVAAWLGSGKPFHIMRDAVFHTELMLAGLWGGVGHCLPGLRDWIRAFYHPTQHRWTDQDFLRAEIWPRIRGQAMIHDGCYDLFGAVPFPDEGRLPSGHHVGAGYPAGQ